MRLDRIFARILLIFSVANVALTAPAIVRQRHLDVAKAASGKRAPAPPGSETSDNGETGGNLPPKPPKPPPPMQSNDHIWAWLKDADSGPPSPAGAPAWPEPVSPSVSPGQRWPMSPPPPENRITIPAQGWPEPPSPESPPANQFTQAQGEWRSSSFTDTSIPSSAGRPLLQSSLGHPLVPSHQDPAPVLTAAPSAPGANRFISDSLKHKLLVSSGVAGILIGAGGLAYGIHQWLNQPYVSPSLLSPVDIKPSHKHSDL